MSFPHSRNLVSASAELKMRLASTGAPLAWGRGRAELPREMSARFEGGKKEINCIFRSWKTIKGKATRTKEAEEDGKKVWYVGFPVEIDACLA